MLILNKILLNTNLNTQDASQNLEAAMGTVLEKGLTYLQESMGQEPLDALVVSIQQTNERKARAYVFNNRESDGHRAKGIQRVESHEVFDGITNQNINMLVDNHSDAFKDFNLSFRRDIILCK